MIEKWRPAKAGDSGLVRYRATTEEAWTYHRMDHLKFDSGGFLWIGGWHVPYCEVLEAYLSDEEVESLADGLAVGIKTFKDLYAEAIRRHFASEKGDT